MNNESIAFIVCIENNKTSTEAILLFESIRKFAGHYKDAPIYSFNPRVGGQLGKNICNALDKFSVCHNDNQLNTEHKNYPQANKIYSCAYAENYFKEDILVFVDSDSIILNEPKEFALNENIDVAVTPVWAAGIGLKGSDDPAKVLWDNICKLCRLDNDMPYVKTILTQENVAFYFNSGLVLSRRKVGVFNRWKTFFEILACSPEINEILSLGSHDIGISPIFFMEQAALSAALMPIKSKVSLLGLEYNCPLHNMHLLSKNYPKSSFNLDSIIHFHYNNSFHKIGFWEQFKHQFNNNSLRYKWLDKKLPIPPLIPYTDDTNFITKFNNAMEKWRKYISTSYKNKLMS